MPVRLSIDVMRLIPAGCFIGTSLILPDQGLFLFGIRPPKRVNGDVIMEITGIGGGLEPGDETVFDGARREAREEIGTEVRLAASDDTLIVYSREQHSWVRAAGEARPAALVFRGYRTPVHHPWHHSHQGQAALIVFWASMLGRPTPCGELPALIWLSPQQILDTSLEDIPLAALTSAGARLHTRGEGGLPQSVGMRMTDSQEAIAIALGQATLEFYSHLEG
jgi:8-oxo-dGTP pyrophosphatase MutT (NUDIX family)